MPDLVAKWETDELGPAKVVFLHLRSGADAIVVIDNVTLGPSIGGTRVRSDVTASEVARLARAMTLKNAVAGLPHGGGKSGIAAPSEMEQAEHERLIREFAQAIVELTDYVPGPDMGTTETSMAFVYDEIGRAVGLPRVLGGIPLNELGATGFGLAVCAEVLNEARVVRLAGARVVIQGFGAVGSSTARELVRRGAAVIAVSDKEGATTNTEGLDIEALIEHKETARWVSGFGGGAAVPRDDILAYPCDILIPAAQPDVVTTENVGKISARVVRRSQHTDHRAGRVRVAQPRRVLRARRSRQRWRRNLRRSRIPQGRLQGGIR